MEFDILQSGYFTVYAWMRRAFQLKGSELYIYAIIYAFTQHTEEHKYRGSLQYLSEWTGISKQSLITNLKKLVAKGLIVKEIRYESGKKYCEYHAASTKEMIMFNENGSVNINQ